MTWRTQSACAKCDPELFFPVGMSDSAIEQETQAIAVCKTCPVQTQCLELALTTRKDNGVWGGKTEAERKEIMKAYHKDMREYKRRTVTDDIRADYYANIMDYVSVADNPNFDDDDFDFLSGDDIF